MAAESSTSVPATLLAAAALLLQPVFAPTAAMAEKMMAETTGAAGGETVQMLFVQSATSGSFKAGRLALEGVGSTLMFTDRPARLDGHMHTANFLKGWDEGPDSFSSDPPNAVLSILGKDATTNVVVELTNPRLEGTTVSYDAKASDGTIPASFETASLFIDGSAGGYIAAGLGGLLLGKSLTTANMNAEAARQEASRPQYAPPAYGPPQAAPGYSYRAAPPPPCTCDCR